MANAIWTAIDLAAVAVILFVFLHLLHQQPSRSQSGLMMCDLFVLLFDASLLLSLLRGFQLRSAMTALDLRLVSMVGLLMALLWFAEEFCHLRLPAFLFRIQGAVNLVGVLFLLVSANQPFAELAMRCRRESRQDLLVITGGAAWYLYYLQALLVTAAVIILCLLRYSDSSKIQKRRIVYVMIGVAGFAAEFLFEWLVPVGGTPAIFGQLFLIVMLTRAMYRCGYFTSMHAAIDNAFNHGSEGLIILDPNHRIVFLNQRIQHFLPHLNEGDDVSKNSQLLRIIQGEDKVFKIDDNSYELRIEDIVENGERAGWMLWFIDQTEQIEAMKKLKEADDAKSSFLMNVSHELRTPMNTVLGMNEMIAHETDDPHLRGYTREIEGAVDTMLLQIEEILDASRLDEGVLEVEHAPFYLDEILEKIEELMRPQAEQKGLEFRVIREPVMRHRSIVPCGDGARIMQVLVNLLTNAILYTDSGCVALTAGLRTGKDRQQLFFRVEDTGIGIAAAEQNRVFQQFERGSNAVQMRRAGLGLGLSIADRLSREMGGSLQLQSELGQGTIVSFYLPYEEATAVEKAALRDSVREQKIARRSPGASDSRRGKRILAVDDNVQNLHVLTQLMRARSLHPDTAAGGLEAVDLCRQRHYDLIFLDHLMPHPDGLETLRLLRGDEEGLNRNTDVVVLTANAGPGAAEEYRRAGFDDYLAKPIRPEQLDRVLSSRLGIGAASTAAVPEETAPSGKAASGAFTASTETASPVSAETTPEDAAPPAAAAKPEEPAAAPADAGADSGDWRQILARSGLEVEKGLHFADDDEEFYRSLLTMFAEDQPAAREKLQRSWDRLNAALQEGQQPDDDLWHTFVVQVHSLKGEARGIGADELGEAFFTLEKAGKARDAAAAAAVYEQALTDWQRLADLIRGLPH
ncbi:MAG: ATP-binding protein [Anaerovoracaceae bacterium]